jgi:hypothetical protein
MKEAETACWELVHKCTEYTVCEQEKNFCMKTLAYCLLFNFTAAMNRF